MCCGTSASPSVTVAHDCWLRVLDLVVELCLMSETRLPDFMSCVARRPQFAWVETCMRRRCGLARVQSAQPCESAHIFRSGCLQQGATLQQSSYLGVGVARHVVTV